LLVTIVAASLLSLVVGLVTTTAAVMRLAGAQLTPVETAVILVGGGLGLVTPLVLIARHVKRVAWNSSVRAVEMLLALRRPLIIAGFTYGFTALFARFVQHVLFPSAIGVASPLWDVLLFVAAVAAGALVALLGRRAKRKQGSAGRPAPLPHPFALSMLLVAMIGTVVIYPVTLEREGEGASEGVSLPGLPFIVIGGNGAKVDEDVPEFSSRDRATTDELEKAKGEGTAALAALSQRYPKDPIVVKALMLEQAKISKGLPDALRTAEKYLSMRKQANDDADVKRVLLKAVDTGGDVADQAFAIMATKMGSEGPDLIYAVLESRPPRRAKAMELLGKPEVNKLATKALRIAFDLYQAKGCKVELLGRAEKEGDERSAKLLRPLLVAPRRGCGFLGMQACPARCPKDEVAIRKAVKAIDARSSK
jgi:serine/threonine-protein kinase